MSITDSDKDLGKLLSRFWWTKDTTIHN